ncbi:MAG TPA: ABC transporter ATP-binding protein, partial [Chloroflexia bacterium]
VMATVQARLDGLDEPAVVARLAELDRQEGDLAAQMRQIREALAAQEATIQGFLEKLEVQAPPAADRIAAAYPAFSTVSAADRPRLEESVDECQVTLGTTRGKIRDLAQRLGLSMHEALDPVACAQELAACAHDIEVRKQAGRIVQAVRERMIQQVLPHTARNMRLLIPLLTLDRYRDCRITEDYKLEIWDEGAGRYVAKSIFSGGTRDQFSLALRLAFALATLPQELGTTPGFIFLDEPLSAFDGPRTQALITLLTQGAIHANFNQIFVISHNRMFDRQAFTHHIRMEGGRVADHDLPRLQGAAAG